MPSALAIDPKIKEWATDKQRLFIDAVNEHGSFAAAAKVMGVAPNAISQAMTSAKLRAARGGYAPGHFTEGVAPGYAMGKVTVQRGPGGTVERTWERQSPEGRAQEGALREFVRHLTEGAVGLSPPIAAPQHALADLLALYGLGDPHFGMYAWAAEAGDDFNLDEAERLTCGAIDRLVAVAPAAETGLLLNAGDFFHADDSSNQTPGSGHALDVDTRHAKVIQVGLRTIVHCIKRMLEKHQRVVVWMMPGNHDPNTAFAFALCISAFFQNEPRVEVDLSPGLYKYLRFGKVLIGAHHGHGAKLEQLPLLMATERASDWGQTDFRYWYGGHIHHKVRDKECPGVIVETLRTLAPRDAWHAGKGYRAGRDAQLIVHHREFGEIERHRCDVAMLNAA